MDTPDASSDDLQSALDDLIEKTGNTQFRRKSSRRINSTSKKHTSFNIKEDNTDIE